MLSLFLSLLAGLAILALLVIGVGALLLPVYLWVRVRDALRAPSAEELAETERLLAEA